MVVNIQIRKTDGDVNQHVLSSLSQQGHDRLAGKDLQRETISHSRCQNIKEIREVQTIDKKQYLRAELEENCSACYAVLVPFDDDLTESWLSRHSQSNNSLPFFLFQNAPLIATRADPQPFETPVARVNGNFRDGYR